MFSFFKKKEEKREIPLLRVDLHSHLIPAIDDGAKNMEESLSLLREMKELGYEKIITTPHIMSDAYRNTPEMIREGLQQLRHASFEAGIKIKIEAAAEYYLDDGFYRLLERGELMLIQDKYLLFETSYISKPFQLEEMIFEITSAGYTPIMAHPERYRYIKKPMQEYHRFKELGVLFQVNLNSFGGHYGESAKYLVHFLSQNGMIDYLGSDAHHQKHLNDLKNIFLLESYQEIFNHNKIINNELA